MYCRCKSEYYVVETWNKFEEHAKYGVHSDYYGFFYNKVCVWPWHKEKCSELQYVAKTFTVEPLHEHTKMLFVISKTLLRFCWVFAFLPWIKNKT